MKKIIINLGLPKSGSTTLQTNIYPNLQNVEFLGRKFNEKNLEIFNKLDDLVENRMNIIQTTRDEEIFLEEFLEFINDSNKNLLISQEYWSIPFTYSHKNENYFINSQWNKFKRLNNFLKKLKCEIVYFIVHRDPIEAIPSFFFTFHHMIINIFGWSFKEVNFYCEQLLKKDNNFKNYNLLFDIYNLKKFEIFFQSELKNNLNVINFNLLNNKKIFLNKICEITGSQMNEELYKFMELKENISKKNELGDIVINVSKPNNLIKFLSDFLKKIKLKNFIKNIFFKFGFKGFRKKDYVIKINNDLLNQAIKLNSDNF